eukprot:814329_1
MVIRQWSGGQLHSDITYYQHQFYRADFVYQVIMVNFLVLSSLLILRILPGTFAASLGNQAYYASKETNSANSGVVSVKIADKLVTVSTPDDWYSFMVEYYEEDDFVDHTIVLSAKSSKPFEVLKKKFNLIRVKGYSEEGGEICEPVEFEFPNDFKDPGDVANNNTDNDTGDDTDNGNINKHFTNNQIVMITLAIFMFVALVALAIDFFTGGCMSKPILGKALFAASSVPASIASFKAASTLLDSAKESGGLGVGAVIAIIFATLFVLAAITGVVFFILHERYGFFRSGFVHVLVVKLKDLSKRDTTVAIDHNQMRGASRMHSIVVAS